VSAAPTPDTGARPGVRVVHRRYVPYSHAHYAGNLVDGAYSLGLFGDVATELCILTDGDEGLFASYADVQFRAPIRAGDVLEITGEIIGVGTRSRVLDLAVHVVARGAATAERPGAASMLDEPLLATSARGTVVVPAAPGG
jgi:3-aminobutyryl-CoA ammonia-lyase